MAHGEERVIPKAEGAGPAGFDSFREDIIEALTKIRRRTLEIVAPISGAGLRKQQSPLMSPIVWDLGHIAEFEDLWLVRRLGEVVLESALPEVFDATRTPRSRRGDLDLPAIAAVLERLQSVRGGALEMLRRVDFTGSKNRLLRGGLVYELVREHEAQHQETILQTILLMERELYVPVSRTDLHPSDPVPAGEMIAVPAGPFEMGAPSGPFAYDNERPCHTASTRAFEIGRFPVSNGEYVEFVASGGYDDPALWTSAGWSWKEKVGLAAPQYWRPRGYSGLLTSAGAADAARSGGVGVWERRTSLGSEPLRATDPVIHVCHYEAEAYARFAGARLPTEAEWEKAAAWDPDSGEARFPIRGGTRPPAAGTRQPRWRRRSGSLRSARSLPGRSPVGCEQMLGDAWEWTSSSLRGIPRLQGVSVRRVLGRVLRGRVCRAEGSLLGHGCGAVARNTFRNWDYPIRRQIFAGIPSSRVEPSPVTGEYRPGRGSFFT